MMVARQSLNVIGPSALALGMLIALQVHLGQWQVPEKKMEHLMYLPDAEYLQLTSMGYQELVADALMASGDTGDGRTQGLRGGWSLAL